MIDAIEALVAKWRAANADEWCKNGPSELWEAGTLFLTELEAALVDRCSEAKLACELTSTPFIPFGPKDTCDIHGGKFPEQPTGPCAFPMNGEPCGYLTHEPVHITSGGTAKHHDYQAGSE